MAQVNIQTTISPYTQAPVCTRPLLTQGQLDVVIADAVKAQKAWRKVTLDERIVIAEKWMAEFEKMSDLLAEDITVQMGRPISSSKGEIKGTLYRAKYLIKVAREALANTTIESESTESMQLEIVKQPLGVIGVMTPWNYPHMCIVNSVLPAILSGNAVVLKPPPQTPSPGERVLSTWLSAGLPEKVLQVIHLDQPTTLSHFVTDPRISFVAFTGSVAGGRAVAQAAASGTGFKGVGLELGGKDPAYVREDADVGYAVENLVDGAFFNSGQSCCSIERIYVHQAVYDEFVAKFAEGAKAYKLGDPTKEETTLGPVVSVASAKRIRKQVKDAIDAGAKALVDESAFPTAKEGTALVGPTVLVDVNHKMEVMMEETFGPVIGIMKVESDDEALSLMNDSPYGLTASVWTDPSSSASLTVFNHFVDELECGTVYLNRADALEPSLPWAGWKDSGRGVSLSKLGFDSLTHPKAVMRRLKL